MAALTPPPRPRRACARSSAEALKTGRAELAKPRSGKDEPVEIGDRRPGRAACFAAVPVAAALRADPDIVSEREWLLTAAVVGTLVELAEPGALTRPDDLRLRAGELPGGFLVLAYPAPRLRGRTSSSSPSRSRPTRSTGCGRRRARCRRA